MKEVKFIHKKPDDYEIIPANGAWGGLTPRGDFICNFFTEYYEIPEELEHELEEDGSLGPIIRKEGEVRTVIREFQIGVLMNKEQAVNLANWILEKVAQIEKEGLKDDSH